tara:strand:+ start:41 stop:421 length:381 start_codon:yes stop_codon:yes gene_type:complete
MTLQERIVDSIDILLFNKGEIKSQDAKQIIDLLEECHNINNIVTIKVKLDEPPILNITHEHTGETLEDFANRRTLEINTGMTREQNAIINYNYLTETNTKAKETIRQCQAEYEEIISKTIKANDAS